MEIKFNKDRISAKGQTIKFESGKPLNKVEVTTSGLKDEADEQDLLVKENATSRNSRIKKTNAETLELCKKTKPTHHRCRRRNLGQKHRKYFQQNHKRNFTRFKERNSYRGSRGVKTSNRKKKSEKELPVLYNKSRYRPYRTKNRF